jgi:hypothetical protein
VERLVLAFFSFHAATTTFHLHVRKVIFIFCHIEAVHITGVQKFNLFYSLKILWSEKMINYILASGAIWIAVSFISSIGHIAVLGKTYKNMNGLLDEQTGKRRLPLYYIGSLAFALLFAYLLRVAWPADVPPTNGAIFGLIAGLAIYIPQMLNQFAAFPYPAAMVIGGAIIGILQTTAAGLIGGLLL